MNGIQAVNHELRQLVDWNWSHPRIVAYIDDLNRIKSQNYNHSNLPEKHYFKLVMFLQVYRRINQQLISFGVNWSHPRITEYFINHSERDRDGVITNRLKLHKWVKLEKLVIDWFCPF